MVNQSLLTTLLPSTTYVLVYAIPLLVLSLVLTFAGAFLTLDRTRSFPPAYDSVAFDRKKKLKWLLEGGVGGLAIGYAFGLHLSTFLSLVIPATTTSASLSSGVFVAVWLLSSIPTTFLSGRWKYCALVFTGLSGGISLSLAIAVIVHPQLLVRVIMAAVIVPILTILCLLPIPHVQHTCVRLASSATGAFGTTLSIALLAEIPAWSNVWDRLWLDGSDDWGTPQEKGLSAGICLFLVVGMVVDWVLKRTFGECPDQRWDQYLSKYAANLPNLSNRAGNFQPLRSLWDRTFHPEMPHDKNTIIDEFNDDDDDLTKNLNHPFGPKDSDIPIKLRKSDSQRPNPPPSTPFEFRKNPDFLKKSRSRSQAQFLSKVGKRREAVKFRPLGEEEYLYSSDSDDEPLKSPSDSPTNGSKVRPWLKTKASSASGTTLNESNAKDVDKSDLKKEKARLANIKAGIIGGIDEAPEYSDYEEDVTDRKPQKDSSANAGWSPGFMRRHRESTGFVASSSGSSASRTIVPPGEQAGAAVPATPSLMKALDRITEAQKTVYTSPPTDARPGLPSAKSSQMGMNDGLPKFRDRGKEGYQGPKWGEFWKDVRDKASS